MILIIEDQYERQFRFLNISKIELAKFKFLLNGVKDKYDEIYKELKNESFDFSKYKCIMSHKSAFDRDNSLIQQRLKDGCIKFDIPLIFFSGGQEATYYDRDNRYVEISSKLFYSQNLKLFLEDIKDYNSPNIDILLYGNQWLLNRALFTLQNINLFIENCEKDEIFYKRFISQNDLEFLRKNNIYIYKPRVKGKFTTKFKIKKIEKSLKNSIEAMIDG